jgi:hypothetical protein
VVFDILFPRLPSIDIMMSSSNPSSAWTDTISHNTGLLALRRLSLCGGCRFAARKANWVLWGCIEVSSTHPVF